MSIPFNDRLSWENYLQESACTSSYSVRPVQTPSGDSAQQLIRVTHELFVNTVKQTFVRGVQFVRDALRLVLKVPVRSVLTPIWRSVNWKERERAKINAKLTGYAFVQLASVPVKFVVALAALATLAISLQKSQYLLCVSQQWTAHLDGRASQLEALKEVGRAHANTPEEYNQYKNWLYSFESIDCRRP